MGALKASITDAAGNIRRHNDIGVRVSSEHFSYYADTHHFVAEASELRDQHLRPLYNDACDQGFVMVSVKTGVEKAFYVARVNRGARSGELDSWQLVSVCGEFTCTVYND